MIHFFTKISKDPRNSEFAKELKKSGITHRYFGCVVPFRFKSRLLFLVIWYPKLIYHGVLLAIKSMVLSTPHPDVVVLETDVDVLVFSLVSSLLPWKRPKIIYLTFIYTARRSQLYARLRRVYYSYVLRNCSLIVCHSRNEVQRYSTIFPKSAGQFKFLPWGGNVGGWRNVIIGETQNRENRQFRVLSAGRSGRDYPTLAQAVKGEDFDVTVICDNRESLRGIKQDSNLRILRNCHGADYFEQLRCCDVVVVPLAVEDVSQGQMVVVQALAYGKPVVVTRTPTISDYVIEGEEALMVQRGDAEGLRNVLRRLRDDPMLYNSLRLRGYAAYKNRHSQTAFTRNLISAIRQICSAGIP